MLQLLLLLQLAWLVCCYSVKNASIAIDRKAHIVGRVEQGWEGACNLMPSIVVLGMALYWLYCALPPSISRKHIGSVVVCVPM